MILAWASPFKHVGGLEAPFSNSPYCMNHTSVALILIYKWDTLYREKLN